MVFKLLKPRSSGLRDVGALLNPDFSAFQVRLLRDESSVALHLVNLAYAGAGTGTLPVMLLPSGFRPPATASATTTRGQLALVTSSGVVQVGNPTTSVTNVTFTFLTREAMPSVFPGSEVS